jgi:uncharacterized protein
MLHGLHDALSVPGSVFSPRALCAAFEGMPGKCTFPGILCPQDERFYCMAGPCCKCGDPVHAASMTLCCIIGYPFTSCKVRGMIREKTKVEGSALKDFLLSCCCNALSLAQEARHLDANPYKGGEIIPLPMWRKCFKSCFPVQKRDERLLLSAREGEMEKCRALLSAGANVNVRDGNENTPLMGAATYGMLETVDFLIKAKAELNAVDRIGATALVKAAQKGHFETVFLLWDSGADVQTRDSFGKSAFDYAVGETKETLKAILRIKVILPCALFVCHCDCLSVRASPCTCARKHQFVACVRASMCVSFEMQVRHQHLFDRVAIFASCISAPPQCPLISLTRTCPFAFPCTVP